MLNLKRASISAVPIQQFQRHTHVTKHSIVPHLRNVELKIRTLKELFMTFDFELIADFMYYFSESFQLDITTNFICDWVLRPNRRNGNAKAMAALF